MSDDQPLAPLRVRLGVFAAMALIALAAIWFIDRRAMIRMHELEPGGTMPPAAMEP